MNNPLGEIKDNIDAVIATNDFVSVQIDLSDKEETNNEN